MKNAEGKNYLNRGQFRWGYGFYINVVLYFYLSVNNYIF
ncbi:hypothetical protein DF16_orf04088 [Bacillus thuringiensis serovar kurstaki str. YBT-1520]|nr:hypothetical protein HD73_2171 [Bacillus thuringiensis serovar kurstaki str. HD73]AIM32503.1 hypothetical protein DF16_orf04088 [Bacillus thuringiensis serovar kurstaki str. YBT-1520]KZD87744.1 hypothetical protein B4120_0200 [Bacillus cereus]CCW08699.1 hypothetical protein EBGED10_54440 [Bacillus sp. GeD10]